MIENLVKLENSKLYDHLKHMIFIYLFIFFFNYQQNYLQCLLHFNSLLLELRYLHCV